ncbi:hypothetical protein E1B28_012007 [Marasmius oreades]|uniref:Uncharacterized protein n=1 Tax=Marasmius oreades TaxID=181124 RepID=A0A9P7RRK9_9AGAR|nr:uncharacterized protein E1B28_012007 [Marasmius oreades]KAG7087966.1 hypothetical protein E1B28_012007 [Marasmius oreades]
MDADLFCHAHDMTFGPNTSFNVVGRDVVHNYFTCVCRRNGQLEARRESESSKAMTLSSAFKERLGAKKDGIEVIKRAKVIMREEVSSKCLVVRLKQTNPFRPRVVEVRRTVQLAEIAGKNPDKRFTVVTLESEDPNPNTLRDQEIWKLWKRVYEHLLAHQRSYFPQLFGLYQSSNPAMIFHEELVVGDKIIDEHVRTPIVRVYLLYIHITSCRALFEDGVLKRSSIPFSDQYSDWVFNLNTCSWIYDITSITLSNTEIEAPSVFFDNPPSLPHACKPKLDCKEIVGAVGPDYLRFVSTIKLKINVKDLTEFLRQGYLTFGAVVDRRKPGILAHFPFVPSPGWYHKSMNPDIQATFSESVPSRLDLKFNVKKDSVRLNLRFSLRLTPDDRHRLRVAYLAQSLSVHKNGIRRSDLVFIEEIRFKLAGNFVRGRPSAYLFVPPPPIELTHGVQSTRWPLAAPFYYWSFDPEGKDSIPKEDWHQYGIPELKLKEAWVGSSWPEELYDAARDYLVLNNYELDGERFARENGCPMLIKGDPHASV